jgi:hypothetical protein
MQEVSPSWRLEWITETLLQSVLMILLHLILQAQNYSVIFATALTLLDHKRKNSFAAGAS